MPRGARMPSSSQIYHVMVRGNNKQNIFIDSDDKDYFLDVLRRKKEQTGFSLYAYCVMDNHAHLVLKETGESVAKVMQRVTVSYALYFNKKYKTVGHVFQDRFRSENVESDSYLLAVIRYVHQNPAKAGLASIDSYPWSSYKDYVGHFNQHRLADVEEILALFAGAKPGVVASFAAFHAQDDAVKCLDVDDTAGLDENTAVTFISDFLGSKKLKVEDLRQPQHFALRQEIVRLLSMQSNLSQRKIAELLGFSRETVRKILLPD